jgi:hypothetical protein
LDVEPEVALRDGNKMKGKMKKLYTLMGIASVVFATNSYAGYDGTVTLSTVGGAGDNDNYGGIFQAVTSANGTFDTFCISISTTFSTGTSYNYDLSSTVAFNPPPSAPTYITAGTAWVYNQFRLGNPSYSGTANGDAVQATIWYLQGLLVSAPVGGLYGAGGTSGGFYDPENGADLSSLINLTALETASGMNLTQLQADGNGLDGVLALNLYDGNNNVEQPQLAQVPEASTAIAGALLLLPFGASTLRILRKNRVA